MNFTPDTKSGTDTNTHAASPARRNGRFAHNGQAGTCARSADVERKMNMEEKKKHMVITIDIDESDLPSVDLKTENIYGSDAIRGVLAGAVRIAKEIAKCSKGAYTVGDVLESMLKYFAVIVATQDRKTIMDKED